MKFSIDLKKSAKVVLSSAMMLSALGLNNLPIAHAESRADETTLNKVDSATVNKNVVNVSFNDGAINGKITFLENGIFRYNVDPAGEFNEYAEPAREEYTATIQAQSDSSDKYQKPTPIVTDAGTAFEIKTADATIVLEKATAKMSIKNKAGAVVMEETESLSLGSKTVQKLATSDDEYFFGGGTQNGRFTHKGKTINIATENMWVNGNVSSPNPFYWSTDGYGVLRNTFKPGSYDFGSTNSNVVSTTHNENEFDAYYFVSNKNTVAETADVLLNDYFEVTGNPMLLPEYAFYLAHLNCYNRDGWQEASDNGKWTLEDGKRYTELGMAKGYVIPNGVNAESLNNTGPSVDDSKFVGTINDSTYKYSARAVVDGHVDFDMPLGWFLPNDGYGCGYGQNGYYQAKDRNTTTAQMTAAIDANVENLKEFTKYAESKGVRSGLWTQAALTPEASLWDGEYQGLHTLRDFQKEVTTGGVSALKTDVAWVGAGYSMALNSVKDGYNILASSGKRPTIVSLDGWAGFQRYASIWTGDQTGGNWEYIRFHIPTYIGQSLSGNPNIGSDVDGIFGGSNLITTRDLQFKTFTQTMLDMDGWGSIAKKPYNNGDPYTSINRMYLKLKAQLMPYIYTEAMNATDGLPMIRAMFLEEANDYTYSTATQYQYMFGDNFLVAPVYQDTNADDIGNDVRNNIYLPSNTDIWVDYFTGKQYRGGQVVNNFDAPIWKLPLFVKNGAIIPMYEENNNPMAATAENKKGLDKTRRIIEFYPYENTSYQLKEDDGLTLNANESDNVKKYGGRVTTDINSSVQGTTATLTANKSTGSYTGYESNRHSTFVVNVSQKPTGITAKNGATDINAIEVSTMEEFETKAANDEAAWFYDEAPNLNKYALSTEDFKDTKITTTPKLYVSFTKTDVNANAQTLIVEGFVNDGQLGKEEINGTLPAPGNIQAPDEMKTPTSIKLTWDAVADATSYDVEVDGVVNTVGDATNYNHVDLEYHSTHRYRVRSRNINGFSQWSAEFVTTSLEDPWRNTPDPVSVKWTGAIWGSHSADLAFDKIFQDGDGGFHSNNGGLNETLTVDYGKSYELETIEYYPRNDNNGNANGTVTRMEFSYSLDGVHWSEPEFYDWEINAEAKIITVNNAARYLKFIPRASVGTFFSAREIKVITKEGKKPIDVGSTNGNAEIAEGDYTNMKNYLGGNLNDDNFRNQILSRFGDVNRNEIYDVYDYAFTMFKLDGGTKKKGSISGSALLIASGNTIKAGDTFTVDVYANDLKNLNAIGAIIEYDKEKVKYESHKQGIAISQMEDLSINKVYTVNGRTLADADAYVNLAFVNRGDKTLYNGTGVVASVTFTALADIDTTDVNTINLSTVTSVGPDYSFIDSVAEAPEIPDVPKETVIATYGQDNMTITITNNNYPTDADGTNVEQMIAQGNYNGLFDGVIANDRKFELKYCDFDGSNLHLPECATIDTRLPVTLHFTMNEAVNMSEASIYNAQATSNGFVTEAEYIVYYEDGSDSGKQSIVLTADEQVSGAALKMEFDSTKKVKQIDFTVLKDKKDTGAQFTLAEAEFLLKDKAVLPAAIAPADTNAKEIYVNQLSSVNAVVTPEEALDKYFTVESSDPSIASIVAIADGNGEPVYSLRGNKPGTVTITLKSHADESIQATYDVTVLEGVDTSDLVKAMDEAKAIRKVMYTDESYAALVKAMDDAVDVLNSDNFTKEDVELAAYNIRNAIAGLVNRPLPENTLINTSADTDVKVIDFSSECTIESAAQEDGRAINVLDYDISTYWHSDYINNSGMPQWLTFDLGKAYRLTDVTILARVTGYHGDVFKAEILTSMDGKDYAKAGTYEFERADNGYSVVDRETFKRMQVPPTQARFVMINILSAGGNGGNDRFAAISEVRFYGTTPIDTSALQTLYNQYKDAENTNYTPESWAMLQNALADAKNVLDDIDATQEEVNTVYTRLENAVKNLAVAADFSKLNEAIDKAEAIDTSKYTASSVAKLDVALLEAKKVANNLNATQKEIDDATNLLNAAIKALELAGSGNKPTDPNKPVTPDKPVSPNQPGTTGPTTIGGSSNILVNTGDDTNIALWVMMLVMASGMAFIAYKKRKEEVQR